MSKLIRDTIEDEDNDDDDDDDDKVREIPLPNVPTAVLRKVVDYMTHHVEEEMTPIQTPFKSSVLNEIVQQWYADYCQVDRNMLFDLVAAANYMDIKPLLDLTCLAVSVLIKGKSAQELREMFNIAHPSANAETTRTTK